MSRHRVNNLSALMGVDRGGNKNMAWSVTPTLACASPVHHRHSIWWCSAEAPSGAEPHDQAKTADLRTASAQNPACGGGAVGALDARAGDAGDPVRSDRARGAVPRAALRRGVPELQGDHSALDLT